MQLLTERAEFLVGCLDLPAAADADGAEWEYFQIDHFNDDGVFRIEDKARQIAWSFTVAAEAVACAVLDAESTVFVSINMDESKEKTRYARRVFEHLQVANLPLLTADNVLGLEFNNGARILSLPSRPPRGKAKMHVVLDEFAHLQHDRMIYAAALPVISRGGRIRIGSSPMGAQGVHWEISRQELRIYPGYTRVSTPWWRVEGFLRAFVTRWATAGAARMETAERVKRFGNERITAIFENMALDDFQQEYECLYVDETTSYFSWGLIRQNQDAGLKCWHIKDVDGVEEVIRPIRALIAAGGAGPYLVGGVDVGRKKHLTEIMVISVGHSDSAQGLCGAQGVTPVLLMVSLDRVKFKRQEACIRRLLRGLPIISLFIDENGIGMQLAEDLSEDTVAQGVTFSNASKALWATGLRIAMENGNVPIPCDRELAYQIHSVKKKVTPAKNVVYDTEANERHHADKMWALALAVAAAKDYRDTPVYGPPPEWRR